MCLPPQLQEDQLKLCEKENETVSEQLSKKERELSEAQHQLKQKVEGIICNTES